MSSARPKLGPWGPHNRAPVLGVWKNQRCVVAWLKTDPEGYRLVDVVNGTNPPDAFTSPALALIWMEVYLQRPHTYTKEDAISEVLDRWGDQEWLLDVRETVDAAGLRLEAFVDLVSYPATDPLPRRLGPPDERVFMVVTLVRSEVANTRMQKEPS